MTDGLAAMKVADIAAKNFPENGGLLLSMIKVIKSASMNFEKVHAHLVELLMSIESGIFISDTMIISESNFGYPESLGI